MTTAVHACAACGVAIYCSAECHARDAADHARACALTVLRTHVVEEIVLYLHCPNTRLWTAIMHGDARSRASDSALYLRFYADRPLAPQFARPDGAWARLDAVSVRFGDVERAGGLVVSITVLDTAGALDAAEALIVLPLDADDAHYSDMHVMTNPEVPAGRAERAEFIARAEEAAADMSAGAWRRDGDAVFGQRAREYVDDNVAFSAIVAAGRRRVAWFWGMPTGSVYAAPATRRGK